MKYIRQRENGSYQFRMYKDDMRISYTHESLDAVLAKRNDVLGYDPDTEETKKPKILLIDIECSPLLVYTWDIFNTYITPEQIAVDWFILCYAYKWLGNEDCFTVSPLDFGQKMSDATIEHKMLLGLYDLLDSADIVIAHNGDNFDFKKINAKFIEYKIPRPSPYKTIDTLKIAKKYFKMTSNKLDYLGKILNVGQKIKHLGLDLWKGCMHGDEKSWNTMLEYNIRDVELLEDIYLTIRHWHKSHPNVAMYMSGETPKCYICGHSNLQEEIGVAHALSYSYTMYRCLNCGTLQRNKTKVNDSSNYLTGV